MPNYQTLAEDFPIRRLYRTYCATAPAPESFERFAAHFDRWCDKYGIVPAEADAWGEVYLARKAEQP